MSYHLKSFVLLAVFCALIILSCYNDNLPTPTTTFAPSSAVIQTTTPTNILVSKAPSLVCNSYSLTNLDSEFMDFPSFIQAITTNLSNCSSVAALVDEIRFIDKGGNAFTVDLNQDQIPEIIIDGVITFKSPPGQAYTEHNSHLVVFYQHIGKYEAKVMFEGTFNGYPDLSAIMDINGDGRQEVVFTIPYGGSGCEELISAIGWQDDQPIDYFRNIHKFLDCPAITEFVDLDQDGIKELIQTPRGPQRNSYGPHKIIFRFDTKSNSYIEVP